MKKYYFVMVSLLTMSLIFTACKKDKNNAATDDQQSSESTISSIVPPEQWQDHKGTTVNYQMGASESKEHLRSIGENLIKVFNANNQKAFANLADNLFNKYQNYDFESFEDSYEDQYYGLFVMPMYAACMTTGRPLPATADIYRFGFDQNSVIWEADETNQTWINKGKASDNSVQLRFKDKSGQQCVVKAWGEGDTKEYTFDVEGDKFIAKLPNIINCTFTQGNNVIMKMKIEQEMAKNNYARFNVYCGVSDLGFTFAANITSNSISGNFAIAYGSTKIISGSLNLPSVRLIDKYDSQSWEDWFEEYEDQYNELLSAIGRGEALVDVWGELQVKVNVKSIGSVWSDLKPIYDQMNDYDWRDYEKTYYCSNYRWSYTYNAWWLEPCYNRNLVSQAVAIINNGLSDANIYYNSNYKQGGVKFEVVAETDKFYCWYDNHVVEEYTYYDGKPVLSFHDGTTYDIEDYFDNRSFSNLIDMAETLVNQYIRLSKTLYDEVGTVEF